MCTTGIEESSGIQAVKATIHLLDSQLIAFIAINGYFNITGQAKGNFTVMSKNTRFNISTSAVLITILSSVIFTSAVNAKVYKWVDENGQVHYGENPGNTQAEQVQIRTNETTTPRAIDASKVDYYEGKDKSKKEAETTAPPEEPKMSKKEKRKLCNEAKSDLAAIMSRGRVREIDEKGEYTYLTEEQRQQRISAAKKKQKEFCR